MGSDKERQDLYRVLQVQPGADPEVVDAAYRRLAAKYHPDVNHEPEATERMKQLNAAYAVLSDPSQRAAYDVCLAAAPRDQARRSMMRSMMVVIGLTALFIVAARLGVRLLLISLLFPLVFWIVFLRRTGR